jgi:hypothetical protein
VAAQHREATVCAGVGRGESLAEGPDGWPRRGGRPRTRLLSRRLVLLGLRHEHDLRVDLVGLRLRLLKLGEHVSIQTEIAPRIEKRRARYRIGGKIGGKHSGRRRNLELDVEHAAEQLGGQIVEAHLVSGDLVHGRLHLLDVALREVEDEVTGARDGDERAGAGAPELRVERIP